MESGRGLHPHERRTFNELHERALLPYQQEREGRWWWENAADNECGLHKGNVAVGRR